MNEAAPQHRSGAAFISGVYIQCVRILLFAFVASTSIFSQSVDELRTKYGSAVSETFTSRRGQA
jgi:hypothetical protein